MLNVKLGYKTVLSVCFVAGVISLIQGEAAWGDESPHIGRQLASLNTITDPNLKNAIAKAVGTPLYFPQNSNGLQPAFDLRPRSSASRMIANSPVYTVAPAPAMEKVRAASWND